jgi:hypothetical protein
MEGFLKFHMRGQDLVRPVTEKAGLEFKPASPAKEKVALSKCIKWDLVCTSKCKRLVMLVVEKEK